MANNKVRQGEEIPGQRDVVEEGIEAFIRRGSDEVSENSSKSFLNF